MYDGDGRKEALYFRNTIIVSTEDKNFYIGEDKFSPLNVTFHGTSSSPLKSSALLPLQKQSQSSLRRLAVKHKRGLQVLKEEHAEMSAPNQGKKLIDLVGSSNISDDSSDGRGITSELIGQLKLLPSAYADHKIPI